MSKLCSRQAIDAAKDKLRIPELWRLLELPGQPRKSCRSPFRKERNASFSIYDQGRRGKDFATGEDFDGPAFLAKARTLSIADALKAFVALADCDTIGCPCNKTSFRKETGEGMRPKPDLSKFWIPTTQEIRSIARDRGLDLAAPTIAKRLGCLVIGDVCGCRSWILTDPRGLTAEARRFRRFSYPGHLELSERKAHTLRGSCKSWPLGLGVDQTLVQEAALIMICEGGPDLLAAWHFIYRTKRWDVLPVSILGRSIHGLHPDALALLKGKRIKFFPHTDPDEGALQQISIIGEQLRRVGCQLAYFDLGGLHTRGGARVKDLNDALGWTTAKSQNLKDYFYEPECYPGTALFRRRPRRIVQSMASRSRPR
jgi:hypothetical protein